MAKWQAISFANDHVDPPSNLYLHDGAALRVRVNSGGLFTTGSSIILTYRLLAPPANKDAQGEIDVGNIEIPFGAVLFTHNIPMKEGFLLSVEVRPGTAVGGQFLRGACFVVVEILQSMSVPAAQIVPLQTIIADYVTTANTANFPSGTPVASASGQGIEWHFNPPNGTPGNELFIPLIGFQRRKLLSFVCDFTTTVTPGARQVQLVLGGGPGVPNRYYPINGVIIPFQTVTLQWDLVQTPRAPLPVNLLTPRNPTFFGVLPLDTLFERQTVTSVFGTETLNLDAAGDQFTNVHYIVEQLVDF